MLNYSFVYLKLLLWRTADKDTLHLQIAYVHIDISSAKIFSLSQMIIRTNPGQKNGHHGRQASSALL